MLCSFYLTCDEVKLILTNKIAILEKLNSFQFITLTVLEVKNLLIVLLLSVSCVMKGGELIMKNARTYPFLDHLLDPMEGCVSGCVFGGTGTGAVGVRTQRA